MNLAKMKVTTRLGLGFGAVLLLLAVITGLGVSRLSELEANVEEIVERDYPKILLAQRMLDNNNQVARSIRNTMLISDPALIGKELEAIAHARKDSTETLAVLKPLIGSEKGKKLFAAVVEAREPFSRNLEHALKLKTEGKTQEAVTALLGPLRETQVAYMERIGALISYQHEIMKTAAQQAKATYVSARTMMLAFGLLALAIGAGAGWTIAVSLLKQLGGEPAEAMAAANRIADGDLSVAVRIRNNDSSSMMYSMNAMRNSLAGIVSQVRSGTESIATASSQIASGNLDLSSRTEQQASSLEETASSMEELTSTVKQNSANARAADQMVVSAAEVAVRGGVAAMSGAAARAPQLKHAAEGRPPAGLAWDAPR